MCLSYCKSVFYKENTTCISKNKIENSLIIKGHKCGKPCGKIFKKNFAPTGGTNCHHIKTWDKG